MLELRADDRARVDVSWPRVHQLQTRIVYNPNTGRDMHVLYAEWAERECRCAYAMGVELGSNELVFTPGACGLAAHTFVVEGALRRLQEMPGQDEELGHLFERIYEELLPTFSIGASNA